MRINLLNKYVTNWIRNELRIYKYGVAVRLMNYLQEINNKIYIQMKTTFKTMKALLAFGALTLPLSLFAQKVEITSKKDKFGLEIDGETVLKKKYEKVEAVANSNEKLYSFFENGQAGLVIVSNKSTIPPFCEEVKYDGGFLLAKKNGLWGILVNKIEDINYQWENIIHKPNWKFENSKKDYFVVTKNGKQGLITITGNNRDSQQIIQVLKCSFDEIDIIEKQKQGNKKFILATRIDNKWGFPELDIKNEFDKYIDFTKYSDDYILSKNGKYGVFGQNWQTKVDYQYEKVEEAKGSFGMNNLYYVTKNGKKGMYSYSHQKELIPCQFEDLEVLSWEINNNEAKVAIVKENGKMRIWQGDKLLEGTYDSVEELSGYIGYFIVKIGDKKGVVGFENVACEFDDIKKERKGYTVTLNNKEGYYDGGKLIVPCEYSNTKLIELRIIEDNKANHFYYVKATDEKENIHLYNTTEQKLIAKSNPAIWTDVRLVNSYFLLYKDNKIGLMNDSGKVVVAPKHDNVVLEGNGYIAFANVNGSEMTLFVYGAESGKLYEQKKLRASDQYSMRKIVQDYGLYSSFD